MRTIKALILALALALSLCACAVSTDTETTGNCAVLGSTEMSSTEIESAMQIVDGEDWCEGAPITQNRDGKLIIVHNVGTVTDAKNGDGITTYGGYIGYHDLAETETISNGDVVDTYLLVNPATDYWDDYIMRWDFPRN